MSAWTDFMKAEFGDDKPISQQLVKEAHRVGSLSDSKEAKLLKAVIPAIAALEGGEFRPRSRGGTASVDAEAAGLDMLENPADIARLFIGMTEGIEFPRLGEFTNSVCEDIRNQVERGVPPVLVLGALANSMVAIIARLEHEVVKMTNAPIKNPPTG